MTTPRRLATLRDRPRSDGCRPGHGRTARGFWPPRRLPGASIEPSSARPRICHDSDDSMKNIRQMMRVPTLSRPIRALIGLPILVLLGCYLAMGVQHLRRLDEMGPWPSISGVATNVDYRRTGIGRKASGHLLVSYRYSVDGRAYTATNASYAPDMTREETLRTYEQGKQISLFYDPERPSDSALSKEGGRWTKHVIAVVSLLFVLTVIYIVQNLRRTVPREAAD